MVEGGSVILNQNLTIQVPLGLSDLQNTQTYTESPDYLLNSNTGEPGQ